MDIKISKTAHACSVCNEKFTHDQNVYSHVLVIEEELNRQDLCGQCKDESVRKQAFSCWTTQYYDPKVAEQEPPERFSPLRQLFYESVEAEGRLEQARAYLAAQLLRRQKVFRQIKESDESDGEVKLILYSDRIGNRLIEVRDPNFSFNELDKARVHLMERLRVLESGEVEPTPTTQQGNDSDTTKAATEEAVRIEEKQEAVLSDTMTPDENLAEDAGISESPESQQELDDQETACYIDEEMPVEGKLSNSAETDQPQDIEHDGMEQQTREREEADHVTTI